MSMDAGKFNFNIGGGKPPQSKQHVTPKESPSVQQDPTESVQIGNAPLSNESTDKVSTGSQDFQVETPQAKSTSSTSSIPTQVGDFLIAGPSSIGSSGGTSKVSFDGLTALNGINSTSLQGINGGTVASVNPLSPTAASKPPTTSADLVVSPFEDFTWVTTSGRSISL